jgi:hypothetical protein
MWPVDRRRGMETMSIGILWPSRGPDRRAVEIVTRKLGPYRAVRSQQEVAGREERSPRAGVRQWQDSKLRMLWPSQTTRPPSLLCYPTTGRPPKATATTHRPDARAELVHVGRGRHTILGLRRRTRLVGDGGAENQPVARRRFGRRPSSGPRAGPVARRHGPRLVRTTAGALRLASIAGSACVFDEIHAYDDALFAALLRFCRCPRASCLLMTASLAASLRMIRTDLGRTREGLDESPAQQNWKG